MTMLDFEEAVSRFSVSRKNGVSVISTIQQLFADGVGRLELCHAVETVEKLSKQEAMKTVVRALNN